jgi:hypothetical protein
MCNRSRAVLRVETYRLSAEFVEDGIATRRGFILRRDPPSSLIDTDRAWEFRTYAAVYPTAVPVPEPLILEEDPGELLRPFSITAEIPGCESSIAMFNASPYSELKEHIGTQKWSILGRRSDGSGGTRRHAVHGAGRQRVCGSANSTIGPASSPPTRCIHSRLRLRQSVGCAASCAAGAEARGRAR